MSIYFLESSGRIKIGYSTNVSKRVAHLKTADPDIRLIGAIQGDFKLERQLHRRLSKHRKSGEWFDDCPDVRAAVQTAINNFPSADAGTDRSGRRKTQFPAVARLLWPTRTAACLAAIAKCDERHAKRFLSGEHEPPLSVVLAVIHEMLREQKELDLR